MIIGPLLVIALVVLFYEHRVSKTREYYEQVLKFYRKEARLYNGQSPPG